jgi:FkbM family methyltransferase
MRTLEFDFKRWLARVNGYDLLGRDQHPCIQAHLNILLRQLQVDVVLDIGANIGQYGTLLRKEGYRGDIHSFEPIASIFEMLKQTAEGDKNWFVHKMAMGDKEGQRTINIMESSDFSSFLKPNEFSEHHREYGLKSKIVAQENVVTSTVDAFVRARSDELRDKRILLKMDTQGFDHEVFKGALESMKQVVAIQSEISFIPIYEGMPTYLDSFRLYEQNGFRISGLYPVSRMENLALVEMDCVAVKAV